MRDSTNYESVLAHQLAMNKETWAELERHGLNDQSKVRLDFTYLAPSRDAANALKQFLRDDSDYDLSVQSQGSFFRKTWTVTGTTQETGVSRRYSTSGSHGWSQQASTDGQGVPAKGDAARPRACCAGPSVRPQQQGRALPARPAPAAARPRRGGAPEFEIAERLQATIDR